MVDRALIIKKEWLDKIFDEGKVWEMRTSKTKITGRIGLIEQGTGLIVGEVTITGCLPKPIPQSEHLIQYHKVEDLKLLEKWKYAWLLSDAKRHENPIPHKHPKGAVIWVKL